MGTPVVVAMAGRPSTMAAEYVYGSGCSCYGLGQPTAATQPTASGQPTGGVLTNADTSDARSLADTSDAKLTQTTSKPLGEPATVLPLLAHSYAGELPGPP